MSVPYPTTLDLIHKYGRRRNDRRCSRCGEFNLFAITYEDKLDQLLLCVRCDTDPMIRGEAA